MPDIIQTNPFITIMHSTTKLAREKYHTLSTKGRTKKQQTLMFSCNDCEESFATRWQLSHHTKETDGHSNPTDGQLLKVRVGKYLIRFMIKMSIFTLFTPIIRNYLYNTIEMINEIFCNDNIFSPILKKEGIPLLLIYKSAFHLNVS